MRELLLFLERLGEASLGAFWLPLLAWTLLLIPVAGVLWRWKRAHPLVHYQARLALLLALPLGLLLAAVADFSFLSGPADALSAFFASLLARPPAATPDGMFVLPAPTLSPAGAAPASAWSWRQALGLVSLAAGLLALARLGLLALHAAALARLRKAVAPHNPPTLQAETDVLARQLGLRRPVHVVVTPQADVPMTFGWRRPCIALPPGLADDPERLRMTLTHELVHIRRHDFLWQWIEQFVGALFFAHPAVALLRRALGHYREMACDAEVLAQPRVSRRQYALLLYSFAVPRQRAPRLVLSMAASTNHLKTRILAMKTLSTHTTDPKVLSLAVAGLLMALSLFAVACTDLMQEKEKPAETQALFEEAYTEAEEMPQLMPSNAAGFARLQQSLRYPDVAKEAGIEGRVLVQLVVNEQGDVAAAEVTKGLGSGLDEEALRVAKTMKFKPGRQDGQAVPVRLTLPFTFKLPDAAPQPSTDARVQPAAAPAPVEDVDEMPRPIGGFEALHADLKYPDLAKKAGIQGKVLVEFTVDAEGNVVNPTVTKGLGGGTDEEAVRAVSRLAFTPAQKDGQAVPVKLTLPITFKLPDA